MNQLVDRFGRRHTYLRISVTDRCNLRCYYCMPAEGIKLIDKGHLLTFDEIERLAKIFVQLGIRKIRLTGGEPLVRQNLPTLVSKLARIQGLEHLALTTNAVLLAAQAKDLKQAGLHSLNISLDTLKQERFFLISKRDNFENVLQGIEAALSLGFHPIKINVVLARHKNEDELLDFVRFAISKDINVRFIEYMPFTGNDWQEDMVVSYYEMQEVISQQYKLLPKVQKPGEVAKDFRIDGHTGSISFITSMTDSFCSSCTRLRLTAEGSIKSCLFFEPEVHLRDILRPSASRQEHQVHRDASASGISDTLNTSDQKIIDLICRSLYLKPESHPPMQELKSVANRPMIEIGG